MTHSTLKNKLLLGASAVAVAAVVLGSGSAHAAFGNISGANTAAQTAGANGEALTFSAVGTLTGGNNIAAAGSSFTGLSITINNAGSLISSTGDNAAVSAGTGSISNITLTTGAATTITSARITANSGTIDLAGAAVTSGGVISVASGLAITNTGANAAANGIYIGGANQQVYTITNAGTISATGNAGSRGIVVNNSGTGSAITINNTGAITAGGAAAGAIDFTGNAAPVATVTNTGTITGSILLGANAASTVALNGGSVSGTVTMNNASQLLTLNGGTVAGIISGAGRVVVASDFTQAAAIGAGTAVTSLTVNASKTLDASGNHAITATNTTLNSGSSIKLGTGVLTSIVEGASSGVGSLTFAGTQTVGATTTIGSTNGLASVIINDSAVVTATNAANVIRATQVTLGSAGAGGASLLLGSSGVIGKIDGDVAGKGNLTFAANNTLQGNIGSSKSLNLITINDGVTVLANTNNNSIAATTIKVGSGSAGTAVLTLGSGGVVGTIDGDAAGKGTLNFNGTGNVTGNIGTTTASLLAVNVNDGATTTLGGNLAATTTTVNTGGSLNLGTTARTITGALTGAGTGKIDFGTAAHTNTGTFTTVAGNTLNLTINSATANASGSLAATTANIAAGTTINVNLASTSGYITSGTKYKILTGTNAATNAATITDNSYVLSFTETLTTVGERTLNAVRTNTYTTAGLSTSTKNVGTTLEGLGANATGEIKTFMGRLDSLVTQAQVDAALQEVAPQTDNSLTVAATGASTKSFDIVTSRLGDLRAGLETTGVASGSRSPLHGVWVQGFGGNATQDNTDGVNGYKANTLGVAVGADTMVNDKTRVGLSFSYANSDVKSKSSASQNTDIDSYQINAYASYDMGQWYVDGMAGVALNSYESSRTITNPASIATGDFDGQTYSARIGGGYRVAAGNGLDLVPNASLTYAHNVLDSYTETGAGNLNLIVNNSDTDALIARAGVNLGYNVKQNGNIIRPELRVAYLYDFVGDNQASTSTFTGGGATFATQGSSPTKGSYNVGAGLNVVTTENVTFTADYDYNANSDYKAHSGVLRARYAF